MSITQSLIALRRLGLGTKSGEARTVAPDPRGFVLEQLTRPQAATVRDEQLRPSATAFTLQQTFQVENRRARKEFKRKAKAGKSDTAMDGEGAATDGRPGGKAKGDDPARRAIRDIIEGEVQARVKHSIATDAPFVERLVLFWSNHFCVSAAKQTVRVIAGGYEREVIRPHVLGRFRDMLLASAQHPAMLRYLDNDRSVGPNSRQGQRRGRGLNENLAREILELHTLGVDGGYSQADVTNFARMLTGWTVGNVRQPRVEPGVFYFAPERHEPGEWTILGKRYPARGLATGRAVLLDLASHPATARHIARKLARHFVADNPPEALVTRLADAFSASDGDLRIVAETLVKSPEVWSAPPVKTVPPYDYLVSLARGFGAGIAASEFNRLGRDLGQPVWSPPSPKGFTDEDNGWIGASAIRERLRIAQIAARLVDKALDPRAAAIEHLDAGLSAETRRAIAQAESREQGVVLLLMSPELMRR